jgi:hypothetical protein
MSGDSIIMDLEERLLNLTPQLVREKIAEHEKQLRLWRAMLPVVEQMHQGVQQGLTVLNQPVAATVKPSSYAEKIIEYLQEKVSATARCISRDLGCSQQTVYNTVKNNPNVLTVVAGNHEGVQYVCLRNRESGNASTTEPKAS